MRIKCLIKILNEEWKENTRSSQLFHTFLWYVQGGKIENMNYNGLFA